MAFRSQIDAISYLTDVHNQRLYDLARAFIKLITLNNHLKIYKY
jgi:hypothetical protein